MSSDPSNAKKIAEKFATYCRSRGFQVKSSDEPHCIRLEVTNTKEIAYVNIYYTSSILVQGKDNNVRKVLNELKLQYESDPIIFVAKETPKLARAVKYIIIDSDIRLKIMDSLNELSNTINLENNPKPDIEFRARIFVNNLSVTLTQFTNGSCLLQGKDSRLFDDTCDLIEKIANPSDEEVIARFVSSDEKILEITLAKYTPQIISVAEDNVRKKIGRAFDFLEPYDKKYYIVSECLKLLELPLPEFSTVVMPASKGYEGFIKELMIAIGIVDKAYFKDPKHNFSILNDTTNPQRVAVCTKDTQAENILKTISTTIATNRHFMMHSDSSLITKVDTQQDAERLLNRIFDDTKVIFDYFNNLYSII